MLRPSIERNTGRHSSNASPTFCPRVISWSSPFAFALYLCVVLQCRYSVEAALNRPCFVPNESSGPDSPLDRAAQHFGQPGFVYSLKGPGLGSPCRPARAFHLDLAARV